MSFGFPPKFSQYYSAGALSTPQFLFLATEAAKDLGWTVGNVMPDGFVALTKRTIAAYSDEITVAIDNGIATLKSQSEGKLFDLGKNRRNIESFVAAFERIKNGMAHQTLEEQASAFAQTFIAAPATTMSQEGKSGFLTLFIPSKGYVATPVLLWLNIAVFAVMVIAGANILQPGNDVLLRWGANFRPLTLTGQWWRLVTCTFIHIGIVHLLMNMYALLFIGLLLERRIGSLQFAIAYFLTGVASSVTSLSWHTLTVSAGASGAIFGMYGVFLALLTTNLMEKNIRKPLLTSIGIFVAYNLLYGTRGNIDSAAHIGGLLTGLFIGYCFYPSLRRPSAKILQIGTIVTLAAIVFSGALLGIKNIPDDTGKYEEKMKKFASPESMALEIYKLPIGTSKEKLLDEIGDRSLYFWYENVKLIEEADQLSIPLELHARDQILLNYCDLRIRTCALLYRAVSADSLAFVQDSLRYYGDRIAKTIDSLKSQ